MLLDSRAFGFVGYARPRLRGGSLAGARRGEFWSAVRSMSGVHARFGCLEEVLGVSGICRGSRPREARLGAPTRFACGAMFSNTISREGDRALRSMHGWGAAAASFVPVPICTRS